MVIAVFLKGKMKKFLTIIIIICLFMLSACTGEIMDTQTSNTPMAEYKGEYYKPELETADQSNIYGMCYLVLENQNYFDYQKAFKALNNMGVKSMRNWMHFSNLLLNPNTVNEQKCLIMKDVLNQAKKYGIQIIGMNHTNYSTNGYFTVGKQKRQDYEGSDYYNWLNDYEQSWYTLVSYFPEIIYWEIDNELNNHDFMYIDGKKGEVMTTKKMADI